MRATWAGGRAELGKGKALGLGVYCHAHPGKGYVMFTIFKLCMYEMHVSV